MRRQIWLSAAVVGVVATLWWRDAHRNPSPMGKSAVPAKPSDGVPREAPKPPPHPSVQRAEFETALRQLEERVDAMPSSAALLRLRSHGPRADAKLRQRVLADWENLVANQLTGPEREAARMALQQAQALLEAGQTLPEERVVRLLEHTRHQRSDPGILAARLETQALHGRMTPGPASRELAHDFSHGLRLLDRALRSGPLGDEQWELSRSLFRAAPQLQDPQTGTQLRRLFARLSHTPQEAPPPERLEALAAAVAAGLGQHADAVRIVDRESAALLAALRSTPGDTGKLGVYIRSLRLAQHVLYPGQAP